MERVAVVLPGRGYTPARPLLHFTRKVLEQHGWTVREVWWQPPALPDYDRWVRQQAVTALDGTPPASMLVGKSLGSLAAPLAAERGFPAVWLTPLLSNPRVVEAITAATAPTLLVGGTADVLWDPAVAQKWSVQPGNHRVFEVDGADHVMETPDPVQSADIVRRFTACLAEFVATL